MTAEQLRMILEEIIRTESADESDLEVARIMLDIITYYDGVKVKTENRCRELEQNGELVRASSLMLAMTQRIDGTVDVMCSVASYLFPNHVKGDMIHGRAVYDFVQRSLARRHGQGDQQPG